MEAGNRGCLIIVSFLVLMQLAALFISDIDSGLGVVVLLILAAVVVAIVVLKMGVIAKFVQWVSDRFNR